MQDKYQTLKGTLPSHRLLEPDAFHDSVVENGQAWRLIPYTASQSEFNMPEEHVKRTLSTVIEAWYKACVHVAKGDWEPLSSQAWNDLVPASLAILSLVIAYFLGKFLARIISRPVCRRVDETLGRFLGKFAFNLVMIVALVSVLGQFGINTASFAAVLTATGFAIGLAFQGTLSNFAAGILLLVFRPFKVGDMVVIGNGMTGKVDEIELFTTQLDTPDNRRIIVPNSAVMGNTIENITFHRHRRIEVPVGLAYDASLDATREALTQSVMALTDITIPGQDRGYQILLHHFGPSSVDWIVRLWVPTHQIAEARQRLVQAIKTQLDLRGLKIPYPQLDIHVAHQELKAIGVEGGSEPNSIVAPDGKRRPRMRDSAA